MDYRTFNRDGCYFDLGMSELNTDYCKKIKYAVDLEYHCLEYIAIEKNDENICQLIRPSNFNYKSSCINGVRKYGK